MALDADTGKVVWEYKFNIFQSDVPPHRVGWASPAADPETGNIYALGVGAHGRRAEQGRQAALGALDRRGVRRVHHARRPHDVAAHRRRSGDRQRRDLELGHAGQPRRTASSRSTSAPATSSGSRRPAAVRTTPRTRRRSSRRSTALRLLICGTGDGAIHAMKPQTGEKVWSFVAAKRAINTGVVVKGNDASSSRTATRTSTRASWA